MIVVRHEWLRFSSVRFAFFLNLYIYMEHQKFFFFLFASRVYAITSRRRQKLCVQIGFFFYQRRISAGIKGALKRKDIRKDRKLNFYLNFIRSTNWLRVFFPLGSCFLFVMSKFICFFVDVVIIRVYVFLLSVQLHWLWHFNKQNERMEQAKKNERYQIWVRRQLTNSFRFCEVAGGHDSHTYSTCQDCVFFYSFVQTLDIFMV